MHCEVCGKELKETDKFCTFCGTANDSFVASTQEEMHQTNFQTHKTEKKSYLGTIVISVLLPIVGFIIFGVNIKTNKDRAYKALIAAGFSFAYNIYYYATHPEILDMFNSIILRF